MNAVIFDVKNSFKGCIAGIHEVLRRQGLLEGIWCLNPEEKFRRARRKKLTGYIKCIRNLQMMVL